VIQAVLFDVGGTLFEDIDDTSDAVRLERLRQILPTGDPWMKQLLARELEPLAFDAAAHVQDTRGAIRRVLERNGVAASDALVERVRAACCMPLPSSGGAPRKGALESLRYAKRKGLKVGLVTNVLWRTQADVLADWESFGFADIDVAVTSLDVGQYKPHPAMFELALAELGVAARDAVMVGNSREADIAPAKRLGMRAVLVRSRETSTSEIAPDVVIDELTEFPPILESWL
jgi:FMN phosphatase YigB (HAD superfamily)